MSQVHYKFQSSNKYATVTFDGLTISTPDLRTLILEKENIQQSEGFVLQLTNAQTKEVYKETDENIPRNTSVTVTRVPVAKTLKGAYRVDSENMGEDSHLAYLQKRADASITKQEQDEIKIMMEQSTADFAHVNYSAAPRMRMPYAPRNTGPPPATYICKRCGQPGHYLYACPNAPMYQNYNQMYRHRYATGIPNSRLKPCDAQAPGAVLTRAGWMVDMNDEAAYMQAMIRKGRQTQPLVQEKAVFDVPDHFLCNICKEIMNDAVRTPCCNTNYCDKCIRDQLIDDEEQTCPNCNEIEVAPDSLRPDNVLRSAISTFLNKSKTFTRRMPTQKPASSPVNQMKTDVPSPSHQTTAAHSTPDRPDLTINGTATPPPQTIDSQATQSTQNSQTTVSQSGDSQRGDSQPTEPATAQVLPGATVVSVSSATPSITATSTQPTAVQSGAISTQSQSSTAPTQTSTVTTNPTTVNTAVVAPQTQTVLPQPQTVLPQAQLVLPQATAQTVVPQVSVQPATGYVAPVANTVTPAVYPFTQTAAGTGVATGYIAVRPAGYQYTQPTVAAQSVIQAVPQQSFVASASGRPLTKEEFYKYKASILEDKIKKVEEKTVQETAADQFVRDLRRRRSRSPRRRRSFSRSPPPRRRTRTRSRSPRRYYRERSPIDYRRPASPYDRYKPSSSRYREEAYRRAREFSPERYERMRMFERSGLDYRGSPYDDRYRYERRTPPGYSPPPRLIPGYDGPHLEDFVYDRIVKKRDSPHLSSVDRHSPAERSRSPLNEKRGSKSSSSRGKNRAKSSRRRKSDNTEKSRDVSPEKVSTTKSKQKDRTPSASPERSPPRQEKRQRSSTERNSSPEHSDDSPIEKQVSKTKMKKLKKTKRKEKDESRERPEKKVKNNEKEGKDGKERTSKKSKKRVEDDSQISKDKKKIRKEKEKVRKRKEKDEVRKKRRKMKEKRRKIVEYRDESIERDERDESSEREEREPASDRSHISNDQTSSRVASRMDSHELITDKSEGTVASTSKSTTTTAHDTRTEEEKSDDNTADDYNTAGDNTPTTENNTADNAENTATEDSQESSNEVEESQCKSDNATIKSPDNTTSSPRLSPEPHTSTAESAQSPTGDETADSTSGEKTTDKSAEEKTTVPSAGEKTTDSSTEEKTTDSSAGERTTDSSAGEKTTKSLPGEETTAVAVAPPASKWDNDDSDIDSVAEVNSRAKIENKPQPTISKSVLDSADNVIRNKRVKPLSTAQINPYNNRKRKVLIASNEREITTINDSESDDGKRADLRKKLQQIKDRRLKGGGVTMRADSIGDTRRTSNDYSVPRPELEQSSKTSPNLQRSTSEEFVPDYDEGWSDDNQTDNESDRSSVSPEPAKKKSKKSKAAKDSKKKKHKKNLKHKKHKKSIKKTRV